MEVKEDTTPTKDNKKLAYTVKEVAELLGISVNSTYKAVENNQLPHIRLGGKILIPKNKLREYLTGETK